jgi:hypothetical protein
MINHVIAASAILLLGLHSQAMAWEIPNGVEVDVFGLTKVQAVESNGKNAMNISCDSDGNLLIAALFPLDGNKMPKDLDLPAQLLLKWNNAPPVSLDASVNYWNDAFLAVKVNNRNDEDMLNVIGGIQGAKDRIQVGAIITGGNLAFNVSSDGSNAAMTTMIEKCGLKLPKGS